MSSYKYLRYSCHYCDRFVSGTESHIVIDKGYEKKSYCSRTCCTYDSAIDGSPDIETINLILRDEELKLKEAKLDIDRIRRYKKSIKASISKLEEAKTYIAMDGELSPGEDLPKTAPMESGSTIDLSSLSPDTLDSTQDPAIADASIATDENPAPPPGSIASAQKETDSDEELRTPRDPDSEDEVDADIPIGASSIEETGATEVSRGSDAGSKKRERESEEHTDHPSKKKKASAENTPAIARRTKASKYHSLTVSPVDGDPPLNCFKCKGRPLANDSFAYWDEAGDDVICEDCYFDYENAQGSIVLRYKFVTVFQ